MTYSEEFGGKEEGYYQQERRDTIERRLLEGFGLFTIIPSLAVIAIILRYVGEGLLESWVLFEITLLGIFFVGVALLTARRFGQQIGRVCHGLRSCMLWEAN